MQAGNGGLKGGAESRKSAGKGQFLDNRGTEEAVAPDVNAIAGTQKRVIDHSSTLIVQRQLKSIGDRSGSGNRCSRGDRNVSEPLHQPSGTCGTSRDHA